MLNFGSGDSKYIQKQHNLPPPLERLQNKGLYDCDQSFMGN
jgi:hypothetical protein